MDAPVMFLSTCGPEPKCPQSRLFGIPKIDGLFVGLKKQFYCPDIVIRLEEEGHRTIGSIFALLDPTPTRLSKH